MLKSKCVILAVITLSVLTACVGLYFFRRRSAAEPTLRFVSIIYRHGDRAPEFSYPLDPYKGDSFWPEGLGALTQKGKIRMYQLGKFLRYRYDGLLSSTYRAAETSVISSHRARCIMSAQLVLAGLYPPEGIQIWNQDLPWQPIPVHSLSDSCDDIIRVTKRCALLSKEFKARNVFIQKIVDNEHELLMYLSNSTGFNVKGLNDIINIYDNLKVVEEQGFPLPNWVRDDYRGKMHSLAMIGYLHLYKPPIMVRLQSGVLINEILSSMKQKSNPLNNFHRRLNMYSAQDRTLLYLWRGLNISQEIFESPPYGSAIIIELHEMKNNYRVKILLKKGDIDGDISTLTIRGCENDPKGDGMCDLQTFSSALQPIVITNFDEACQN